MRQLAGNLLIAPVAIVGSVIIWLGWAQTEYRGLASCPWDSHRGQPILVGAMLTIASTVIVTGRLWKTDRTVAVGCGLLTAAVTGIAIAAAALFFGAGLRCTD